jgi:hypothetical protein
MRSVAGAVVAGACAILLAGCELEELASPATVKEDFSYSYPLKAGGRLSVESLNGSIRITGWERQEVEIRGTRQASSKELLEAMRIDIVPTAEAVRIRVVRPSGRRGSMGASFTIRAPRQIVVERAETSNGGVEVEDIEGEIRLASSNGGIRAVRIRGDVEASTSNGPVELAECSGAAVLRTSNGRIQAVGVRAPFEATTSNARIEARLAEAAGSGPVKLRTSNGSVRLTLDQAPRTDVVVTTSNGSILVRAPATLAARVKASTSNGSVSTSFEVEGGERGRTRLEGMIGGGGPTLELETSNGSIEIEEM